MSAISSYKDAWNSHWQLTFGDLLVLLDTVLWKCIFYDFVCLTGQTVGLVRVNEVVAVEQCTD